jgi:hypothetical protein
LYDPAWHEVYAALDGPTASPQAAVFHRALQAQQLLSATQCHQLHLVLSCCAVLRSAVLVHVSVQNQEAASAVLAELSHVLAKGNAVVASQKLVLAVQKLQRLPTDLQAEGALASLRLIAEVSAAPEGVDCVRVVGWHEMRGAGLVGAGMAGYCRCQTCSLPRPVTVVC